MERGYGCNQYRQHLYLFGGCSIFLCIYLFMFLLNNFHVKINVLPRRDAVRCQGTLDGELTGCNLAVAAQPKPAQSDPDWHNTSSRKSIPVHAYAVTNQNFVEAFIRSSASSVKKWTYVGRAHSTLGTSCLYRRCPCLPLVWNFRLSRDKRRLWHSSPFLA